MQIKTSPLYFLWTLAHPDRAYQPLGLGNHVGISGRSHHHALLAVVTWDLLSLPARKALLLDYSFGFGGPMVFIPIYNSQLETPKYLKNSIYMKWPYDHTSYKANCRLSMTTVLAITMYNRLKLYRVILPSIWDKHGSTVNDIYSETWITRTAGDHQASPMTPLEDSPWLYGAKSMEDSPNSSFLTNFKLRACRVSLPADIIYKI